MLGTPVIRVVREMTNKSVLDNLSSITSGVDLTKVPPIHQKRLLTFVNHFIITTVSFLNNFAQTCEQKLLYCDNKLQKLEAEMCILEAKLNSIPGLDEAQFESKSILETHIPASGEADEVGNPPTQDLGDKELQAPESVSQSAESEVATPSGAKDPALVKFFKMVQFGVPIPAVKLKMQQEGFEPSLLDS